ncbi:hypothetical protein ANN_02901 [Periplaneta americana]|uniref:C2H2-type domain-containing protein n=1 Tax=Periplaneta americana TaxID=6978 RepID=A0ABQ8TXJ4_PERAM|nr:hypothetical protein ANN_02901 [Periplaneta americana]
MVKIEPRKSSHLMASFNSFRTGFHKRCEHENCAKGFEKDRHLANKHECLSDDDFLPAATTDIQIADRELPAMNQEILETERANDIPIVPSVGPVELTTSVDEPEPLFSFPFPGKCYAGPKSENWSEEGSKKRGKTAILTSSPYKAQLQEAQKTKELKQTKVKRKLLDQEKIGNSEKQSRPKPKKVRKTAEEKDEDTETNELYSTSNEGEGFGLFPLLVVTIKKLRHNNVFGRKGKEKPTGLRHNVSKGGSPFVFRSGLRHNVSKSSGGRKERKEKKKLRHNVSKGGSPFVFRWKER